MLTDNRQQKVSTKLAKVFQKVAKNHQKVDKKPNYVLLNLSFGQTALDSQAFSILLHSYLPLIIVLNTLGKSNYKPKIIL